MTTSSLDMVKCSYFPYLRDAINIMFVKDDGGQKSVAMKNLGHLLNNVSKHLKGKFTWEKNKEQLKEVVNLRLYCSISDQNFFILQSTIA